MAICNPLTSKRFYKLEVYWQGWLMFTYYKTYGNAKNKAKEIKLTNKQMKTKILVVWDIETCDLNTWKAFAGRQGK